MGDIRERTSGHRRAHAEPALPPSSVEVLGSFRPRVLLTLGSGLSMLADDVSDARAFAFADLGLPASTVAGHPGRFVAGHLGGVPVLVQQGRLHLYEGVEAASVVSAVRFAAAAGADTFVVTNAAGGLHDGLQPGDLMLITDHLNLTGASPLSGAPTFVDMSAAYTPALQRTAMDAAAAAGVALRQGVYAGVQGPAYETPAEARMLQTIGGDAVGMSTVLEVIAARALGMQVLGLSVITNVHQTTAAPEVLHEDAPEGTEHDAVLAVSAEAGERLARLVREVLTRLGDPRT